MKRLLGFFLFFILIANAQAGTSTIFIDVISWQVREGGADNWAQVIPPAGLSVPARIIPAPFEWNKGLRLGIGYVFASTGHDIALIYTTYHTLATSQAQGVVASSFDGNYFANNTNGASLGPTYQSAAIRWQFYYKTLDLIAGHRFNLKHELQFHPYVGLRLASINQSIFSNWYHPTTPTTFSSATENLKNNFFGIGPSIGIDTTWPLFPGNSQSISLMGNFIGALLYGHWHFSDIYANNTPVNININVSSVNGAAPMLGGLLGFQWTKQFAHSSLSASIGYEVQAWFNQIQFYSLNGGRFNRSTFIQGGDFEVQYHF